MTSTRLWQVVAWLTRDGTDATTPPVPIQVTVEAGNEDEAYSKGHDAIVAELEGPLRPLRLGLINWYVREATETERGKVKRVM